MNQGVMLYIHIPFCIQKCKYCDFLSFPTTKECRQKYVDALIAEIRAWKGKMQDSVSSVFIGGGTPSLLEPEQIGTIMEELHNSFHIEESAEQTIEANPGTITEEKAECWMQKGINRISMGVQALDDALLDCLGRIHNTEQVWQSWQILKKAGFDNISMDLMMGLPGQTLQQWEDTLRNALKMQPVHLSCYSLIIEEGTPFYDHQEDLHLPDEDTERRMYELTQRILSEVGIHQYEISNYAVPGFESRHNTGYWRRRPYIGLGLGAASLLKEQIRYHNTNDMDVYLRNSSDLDAIQEDLEQLSVQDQMEEFMFLGLRCTQGVQLDQFKRAFGYSMEDVYSKALGKNFEKGLLSQKEEWIFLTSRGMDVANQVFADFLLDA